MQALNLVDQTSYAFFVTKFSLISPSDLCICYDKLSLFTCQAQPESIEELIFNKRDFLLNDFLSFFVNSDAEQNIE